MDYSTYLLQFSHIFWQTQAVSFSITVFTVAYASCNYAMKEFISSGKSKAKREAKKDRNKCAKRKTQIVPDQPKVLHADEDNIMKMHTRSNMRVKLALII